MGVLRRHMRSVFPGTNKWDVQDEAGDGPCTPAGKRELSEGELAGARHSSRPLDRVLDLGVRPEERRVLRHRTYDRSRETLHSLYHVRRQHDQNIIPKMYADRGEGEEGKGGK